jgi:alginate O-acetyltransferase complex protein AlgI
MSLSSLEFLLLFFLASAVFFRFPSAGVRRILVACGSVAFLSTYIPNPRSWIVLAGFLLSGYGCGLWLRIRPSRIILTLYLVLLIATFAVLKKYIFLRLFVPESGLSLGVEIVGLSYMLFRQIQFLVDAMQEQVEHPTLASYLAFQLDPFTLLAGPIQRYQDFQEYWQDPAPLPLGRHEVLKAYFRLFVGILKMVVFSNLFERGFNLLLGRLEPANGVLAGGGLRSVGTLIAMVYCYLFYLYMNFSGYCDLVIAAASLLGLRLPENFNKPFLARNMIDYWSRWHITLGHWIRDYLFTPIYKAGVERIPSHGSAVAVVAYFIAFFFAGIWHGSTKNFVIYGLLHGLGVSVAKLWENGIVRYAGRSGLRTYLKSTPIRLVATFVTFHYVCIALFFFALDLDRGWPILARVLKSIIPGY